MVRKAKVIESKSKGALPVRTAEKRSSGGAWVAGRPEGSRRLVAAASHRPEFSAKNLPQSNLDAHTVNFPLVPEQIQFFFASGFIWFTS